MTEVKNYLDNVKLDGLFTAIATDISDYNNYRIIPSSGALSWIGNSNDQDIFAVHKGYGYWHSLFAKKRMPCL